MKVLVQRQGRRAAFTLVELLIAIAIVGLITYNLFMVLGSSSQAYKSGTFSADLEAQAQRTAERIAMALISSSRASLYLTPESPFNTSEMNYEQNLGFENGQIVWSDPERIAMVLVGDRVLWVENPGQADERSVVWCRNVREYLEGEEPNGLDDNGNGLIDERGLSFDIDGDSVLIRLTLERRDSRGRLFTHTVEQRITCRN